jgi:hypothetical protein
MSRTLGADKVIDRIEALESARSEIEICRAK